LSRGLQQEISRKEMESRIMDFIKTVVWLVKFCQNHPGRYYRLYLHVSEHPGYRGKQLYAAGSGRVAIEIRFRKF